MSNEYSVQGTIAKSLLTDPSRKSKMAKYGIVVSIESDNTAPLVFDHNGRSTTQSPTVTIRLSDKAVTALAAGKSFSACRCSGSLFISGNFTHWEIVSRNIVRHDLIQNVHDLLNNKSKALAANERVCKVLHQFACDEHFMVERNQLAYAVIPGFEHTPWINVENIELTELVKEFFPAIREEALQLIDGSLPSPRESDKSVWELDTDPLLRWPLFRGGSVLESFCEPFPETRKFIELAAKTNRLVNLCFLVTFPGDQIPHHSDGYSIFASWHAGIIVPDSGCGLEFSGTVKEHKEGQCIAFDDSFTHSAWNRSHSKRVALSSWYAHPEWTAEEAKILIDSMYRIGVGL